MRRPSFFLLSYAVLGLAACANPSATPSDAASASPDTSMHSLEDVLATHTDSLMALEGVTGVGQALCEGAPCLRVYVAARTPALERELPDTLGGYPVEVVETGQIRPRPTDG